MVVDSFDSATEGVGEQDSAKPSRAIAPLLDIAHRENGPAVLVLGNCVRSGSHSRGSGVAEDRADIVYEVRDATDFKPSGTKPWIEELPPADASSWAKRSARRKQRQHYRLAFIPTKCRITEEPEPFVMGLDLSDEPWKMTDVTDEVDREGAEARAERQRQQEAALGKVTDALVGEIKRRAGVADPPLCKEEAVLFLRQHGANRKQARELITSRDGVAWSVTLLKGGCGTPRHVLVPVDQDYDHECGYTPRTGGENARASTTAPDAGSSDSDSRREPSVRSVEIPPSETRSNCGYEKAPFLAAVLNSATPNGEAEGTEGEFETGEL